MRTWIERWGYAWISLVEALVHLFIAPFDCWVNWTMHYLVWRTTKNLNHELLQ